MKFIWLLPLIVIPFAMYSCHVQQEPMGVYQYNGEFINLDRYSSASWSWRGEERAYGKWRRKENTITIELENKERGEWTYTLKVLNEKALQLKDKNGKIIWKRSSTIGTIFRKAE